jgi:hypothetical protein
MRESMRDDELETTLREIGQRLDYPQPTAMANAVRARLREPRRAERRGFGFAPAFITLGLLAIVITLGSPDVRGAAGEFLHLRGIDIFRVPSVPATLPPLQFSVAGERTTLDAARQRIRFTPRVGASADLGAPDDVFVETVGTTDRLTLVYRQRSGIPVSASAGVSALVVEARGTVDEALFAKAAGPGTRVEPVSVNGGQGFWLEGAPHVFFYRDASGNIVNDTLRLAGNTLVWVQDGVTIRLEAQVAKERALQIAATFR